VLFVDQSGEPGGAELCLLDLLQHMRNDCRVAVMSDGPFRRLLEKACVDYDLVHIPSAVRGVRRESGISAIAWALPGVAWSAFRLVRLAAKADVVYANTQKAFVIGALAARIARRPLVWHLHDILSEAHFNRISTRIVVWLSKRLASRIIANSKATATALVKAGGDARKIEVIWNGIDCAPFDDISATEVAACRASLNVGNAPIIGLFGRLAAWKGQHILIDALPDLPGVHALIVGAELYGNQGYGNELIQRARDRGVSDRTHFLGFREDIPLLMRSVDVIVHTSTAPEPFGRVIVEGMLAGRPVIAAAGGGPEEIIENGISGLIVPPADSGALAAAVSSALKPSPWRERMIENAKSRAQRLFSSDAMIRSIKKTLYTVSNESI
jgi:glycosyltransferase involved in cell wall biosynthesis